MKLYATIKNEKGKREGIGGNEQLTIEINRGNRRMVELYLTIDQLADNKELVVLDLLNLSDGSTTRVYEHELNKTLPEYVKCSKCLGTQFVYNSSIDDMELCSHVIKRAEKAKKLKGEKEIWKCTMSGCDLPTIEPESDYCKIHN